MKPDSQNLILAVIAIAAFQLDVYAEVPEYLWVSTAPKELGENTPCYCDGIAIDRENNCFVAGHYWNGNHHVLCLAKYSPAGTIQWLRKEEGEASVMCNDIALDNTGNCYLTGQFWDVATFGTNTLVDSGRLRYPHLPEMFVAKYDGVGRNLWAKRAGGEGQDIGSAIAVDDKGAFYVGGTFSGTADFDHVMLSGTKGQFFIARYHSNGMLDWVQKSGGEESGELTAIDVDRVGDCVVVGSFNGTSHFGGTTLSSRGRRDGFVAKYDSSGNVLWTKQVGGSGGDYIQGVAVDREGNCYVVGTFERHSTFESADLKSAGADDIFIARFDSAGSLQWVQTAGGPGNEDVSDIAIDASGELYIAGEFRYTARFGQRDVTCPGGRDKFVAVYSPDGELLWVCTSGQVDEPCDFYQIVVDGLGHCYLAGYFEYNADLGRFQLRNKGNSEMLLVKLETWRRMQDHQSLNFNRINTRLATLVGQVLGDGKYGEWVKSFQIRFLQKESDVQLDHVRLLIDCEIAKVKTITLDQPLKISGELLFAKEEARAPNRSMWKTRTTIDFSAKTDLVAALGIWSELYKRRTAQEEESAIEAAYEKIIADLSQMAVRGTKTRSIIRTYYAKCEKLWPQIDNRLKQLEHRLKEINEGAAISLNEFLSLESEYRSLKNMKLMFENMRVSKSGDNLSVTIADCPASIQILSSETGLDKVDTLRVSVSAKEIAVHVLATAEVPPEKQENYNRVRDRVVQALVAFQNGENDEAFKSQLGAFFQGLSK